MSKWIIFAHNGLEYGPIEETKLVFWIKERRVAADDLVKPEGAKDWQVVGEINIFASCFRDRPTPAGSLNKALKNESEGLKKALKDTEEKLEKIKQELAALSLKKEEATVTENTECQGCSFMEGVERLHEEKKILEEKLAEERGRLREVNLTLERGGNKKEIDKPLVIEEKRPSGSKRFIFWGLVILALLAGVFIYQGFMLRETVREEERAWDREGDFYKNIREKDIDRLSALEQELENFTWEKAEAEKHVATLLSEKTRLENERKTLEENLRKLEQEAKEALARQERELKNSLSQEYKNEINNLKDKAGQAEKIREELQARQEALQKIEEELDSKNKELEKLNEKNRDLLEGLIKANRSNEYLTQKIEDLQKVRKELEEELRRRQKSAE